MRGTPHDKVRKTVMVKMMVDIKNPPSLNDAQDADARIPIYRGALAGCAQHRLKPRHPGVYHLTD